MDQTVKSRTSKRWYHYLYTSNSTKKPTKTKQTNKKSNKKKENKKNHNQNQLALSQKPKSLGSSSSSIFVETHETPTIYAQIEHTITMLIRQNFATYMSMKLQYFIFHPVFVAFTSNWRRALPRKNTGMFRSNFFYWWWLELVWPLAWKLEAEHLL